VGQGQGRGVVTDGVHAREMGAATRAQDAVRGGRGEGGDGSQGTQGGCSGVNRRGAAILDCVLGPLRTPPAAGPRQPHPLPCSPSCPTHATPHRTGGQHGRGPLQPPAEPRQPHPGRTGKAGGGHGRVRGHARWAWARALNGGGRGGAEG